MDIEVVWKPDKEWEVPATCAQGETASLTSRAYPFTPNQRLPAADLYSFGFSLG